MSEADLHIPWSWEDPVEQHTRPNYIDLPPTTTEHLSRVKDMSSSALADDPAPTLLSPTSDCLSSEPNPRPIDTAQSSGGIYEVTPVQEQELNLDVTSIANIFPIHDVSPPLPCHAKAPRSLRLPPFDVLGIAAPHPDKIGMRPDQFPVIGAGPLSDPADPLHIGDTAKDCTKLPDGRSPEQQTFTPELARVENGSIRQLVPVFTPPEETGVTLWGGFAAMTALPIESPAQSDPESNNPVSDREAGPSVTPPTLPGAVGTVLQLISRNVGWLEGAAKIILSEILIRAETPSASLRVLSHALPCPSPRGHIIAHIVEAIHEQQLPGTTSCINVFHAVPGRFNMDEIPKSPPSTPGSVMGGEDYFTRKVFDSAVQMADYQQNQSLVPATPQPAVEPCSIDVTVAERYIPPTNTNEFFHLFNVNRGRSFLIDRLAELSRNSGLLLFIYPTWIGGQTFTKKYLGPILDPLLRSITVVNDLSADLSASLGRMIAAQALPDYDTMHKSLENLCHQLTQGNATFDRLQRGPANFKVIYSAKEEVMLDRSVWLTEWWIKQEKTRIRETVTKHIQKTRKITSDAVVMATPLVQEILDGLAERPYPEDGEPKKGVEVGVFIVQKTEKTV